MKYPPRSARRRKRLNIETVALLIISLIQLLTAIISLVAVLLE